MEINNQEKNNTLEQVLQKIESGTIQAHSKNYFRLRIFLLIFLIAIIFIISAFLCSLILFNIEFTGQFSLIGFGTHGTNLFLKMFPWVLFGLNILLITLAGILARSFRFGYKTPAIYLGLGVVIAMSLAGIVVTQATNLHHTLWQNAQNNTLPVFGSLYRHTCSSPSFSEKIYRGTVLAVEKDFITVNIQSEKCGRISVYKIITNNPRIQNKTKMGDNIFIEGEIENGIIYAETIGPAPILPKFFK